MPAGTPHHFSLPAAGGMLAAGTGSEGNGGMATDTEVRLREPREDSRDTRDDILKVATREFADKGLSGARVDEIAELTRSSKRMIYYHFGSKEELYRAVLERAYAGIRRHEQQIDVEDMPPVEALRRICEVTFDYHQQHPEFVRLVMNENMLHGETIVRLDNAKRGNRMIIERLETLLERGATEGTFRPGLDPVDLHMSLSALCFHAVSNRYTFSANFDRDMSSPPALAERRAIVAETMLRWCCSDRSSA